MKAATFAAPRKQVPGTVVTADYSCASNDTTGVSRCEQRPQPSAKVRGILLREMRQIGLPLEAQKEVYFKVLKSTSGLSLMEATYEHINGLELTVCEVIVVARATGESRVLRKLPLQKMLNADAADFTTWSPVDIADVDGDGNVEIVLEGDAYEDHWFEVVRAERGSFKTIFSGLGYYL